MNSCEIPGMQDRELYRRLLGIEALRYVERVELKLTAGEVHVCLDHEEVEHWACAECGAWPGLTITKPSRGGGT